MCLLAEVSLFCNLQQPYYCPLRNELACFHPTRIWTSPRLVLLPQNQNDTHKNYQFPIFTHAMNNTKTELNNFLRANNLLNDGPSQFAALVTIITASNTLDPTQLKASATPDGLLSFLENRLNSLIYPTDFDARWQTFRYSDDQLIISGTHPKKQIGKYTVKISPIMQS